MNRGGAGAPARSTSSCRLALNPASECKVERFGWTFAPSDKVMEIEIENDKEVYNVDIGPVGRCDPEAGELTARFDGLDRVSAFPRKQPSWMSADLSRNR